MQDDQINNRELLNTDKEDSRHNFCFIITEIPINSKILFSKIDKLVDPPRRPIPPELYSSKNTVMITRK